jgi:predicted nucleic acid-binding Zn ribbon protein
LEEVVAKGKPDSVNQVGVNEGFVVVIIRDAHHFSVEACEFVQDMPEEPKVHDLMGCGKLGDWTVYAGVITRGTGFYGGFFRENGGDHDSAEGESHRRGEGGDTFWGAGMVEFFCMMCSAAGRYYLQAVIR